MFDVQRFAATTVTGFGFIQDSDKTKLDGITSGAQPNVIETVKVNNVALTVTNKAVNIDLSEYVKGTDVASALQYKGTVASFAELPANSSLGHVYNITSAGGQDANGTSIKAGDNVVYNGTGWDVLAGTVDLSNYQPKEAGKGLSTNDYTTAEKNKLAALDSTAQPNVIETVKVNNTALTPTDKAVNIDLSNYQLKESGKTLTTNDYTTTEKTKLAGITAGAQPNVIETIKVNNTALTPTDKAVNIDLSGYQQKETGKGLSTNDYTTAEKDKLSALPEAVASASTAVTSLSASGTTITYKNAAGTSLGTFTTQDTNTHYTTKLIAGASNSTVNAAAANGSVYLRLFDDSTARSSLKIVGSGAAAVTSSSDGTLTITSTGGTYSTGTDSTAGLTKLYTTTGTATDGTLTQAAINTALSSKMASNTNVTTVVQTPNTDNAAYPILLKASTATTVATSTTLFASGITVNPNTKTITATTFSGNATTATKATQDGSGNVITDTYLTKAAGGTKLSVSGTTLTLQNAAGSNLSSVTTQDTHYTTKLIAGASNSTANAAATNGNVYFRLFDDSTARSSLKVVGSGATAVTSASDGTVTIASTNTTYSTATASALGLTKLYTGTGTNTDGTMTQAAINTALSSKMASNTTVTNVVQTVKADNAAYPVLMAGASTQTTTTTTSATFCTGVKINPSACSVTATTFIGALNGNATSSGYPLGFTERLTTATWGNQSGTVITDWHTSGGGDIAFRDNNGSVNVVTDGYFYQNEGQYQCLDTNNYTTYAPTKTGSGASGTWGISVTGSAAQVTKTLTGTNTADLLYAAMADNDYFRIRVGGTATNAGYVELATADDANEPIYVRQYSGTFTTLTRTATLLDASGNTSFPGTVTASAFSGNASSATQLATSRTIQTNLESTTAASFNGTANITPGVTGTLPIANGGTNATTVANARKSLFGDAMTTANGQHFIMISDSYTNGGYLPLESTRALVGTGYAACSTAAATAAKVVTLAGFALATGRQVMVNFSATNTAAAPTLNVNSTGAKSMCSRSGVVLTYQALGAGIHHFVYDGTYYREVTPIHCTRYTSCATAAATVAKVVTCDNWVLETGARITVKFTVTNTAANPTLNVNSSGAKAIYYRGYAVVAAALQANTTYDLVYNGTQFEITGSLLWTE